MSTWISPREAFRAELQKHAEQGDYKWMLDQLLAVLHRDGGQYTALSGYTVSVEDAMHQFYVDRTELQKHRVLCKPKASSSSSSASASSHSSSPGSEGKKRNG